MIWYDLIRNENETHLYMAFHYQCAEFVFIGSNYTTMEKHGKRTLCKHWMLPVWYFFNDLKTLETHSNATSRLGCTDKYKYGK